MKNFILTIATVITTTSVLGACGNKTDYDQLAGKYVRSEDSSKICYEYYDFKEDNIYETQNSKKVSGYVSTGKYEILEESNEIKFNSDEGGSHIQNFKFSEDKTAFSFPYNKNSDMDTICTYEKAE